MNDPDFLPPIAGRLSGMDSYDAVFVGFPIWWYTAPRIIQTFLEDGDFSGKQIVPFATSGGSGLGHTVDDLRASCGTDTCWQPGRLCNGRIEVNALEEWARQF